MRRSWRTEKTYQIKWFGNKMEIIEKNNIILKDVVRKMSMISAE